MTAVSSRCCGGPSLSTVAVVQGLAGALSVQPPAQVLPRRGEWVCREGACLRLLLLPAAVNTTAAAWHMCGVHPVAGLVQFGAVCCQYETAWHLPEGPGGSPCCN
jgi:hypothetical protein